MTTNNMPFGAGQVTPESDDAAGLGSEGGTTGQGSEVALNCAAGDAEYKAFVTLQARAAMLGYELIALGAHTYMLSRWGLTTRELPDLRTVAEMLRRIGGRQ